MKNINNLIRNNTNFERIDLGKASIDVLIRSDETEDKVGVYQSVLEPQTMGAPMHVHRIIEEIFYVIEGELSIIIGTEHVIGRAGDVIFIPKGTHHGFSNKSKNPLKFMLIFSPALAREGYFEGMAEMLRRGESFDSEAFLRLMKEYDQELVKLDDTWLTDFSDNQSKG